MKKIRKARGFMPPIGRRVMEGNHHLRKTIFNGLFQG